MYGKLKGSNRLDQLAENTCQISIIKFFLFFRVHTRLDTLN